jgi:carbamoyltransferase
MISLGINYSRMHDSAACLVEDGTVKFAIAEERLSRLKQDSSFPRRAIQACLKFVGISVTDLDYITQSWPKPGAVLRHDLKCMATGQVPMSFGRIKGALISATSNTLDRGGAVSFERGFGRCRAPFRFIDHHLAHAISGYSYSGFENSAILVIDGRGAWESTSLWHGVDGKLTKIWTLPWPNSLGLFYAYFTDLLGFTAYSDEWKVMGLAPYGIPGFDLKNFIVPRGDQYQVNSRGLLKFGFGSDNRSEGEFGLPRLPESPIEQRHKDIAFATQEACENAMLALAREAVARTGSRNLCLAGGVALNSKANGKILASGIVDRIFIQPAAGDDGACLGAALSPYLVEGKGRLPVETMRHAYFGTEYSDSEIESSLTRAKLPFVRVSNPSRAAAELISRGKILGWFQGRMEFGPRALGNRSILADARDPQMTLNVNNAVKFREPWRPFAPSILKESSGRYLESATDSPFMILTAQVRPEKRGEIPAVTHVDGSARPHTVEREENPKYWELISEFERLTGVPAVLNTSFNLRGEPIVESPGDAIRTFYSSGLDALVLGSFLVEKYPSD